MRLARLQVLLRVRRQALVPQAELPVLSLRVQLLVLVLQAELRVPVPAKLKAPELQVWQANRELLAPLMELLV